MLPRTDKKLSARFELTLRASRIGVYQPLNATAKLMETLALVFHHDPGKIGIENATESQVLPGRKSAQDRDKTCGPRQIIHAYERRLSVVRRTRGNQIPRLPNIDPAIVMCSGNLQHLAVNPNWSGKLQALI
jgi:hypothetical protein